MNVLRNMCVKRILPMLNLAKHSYPINAYHTLFCRTLESNGINNRLSALVNPLPVFHTQICGFKFKGIVRRRCKDCYIIVKDRQQIVLCKTHKRHKQKQIMPKEKDTWIITHKTSGVRPW